MGVGVRVMIVAPDCARALHPPFCPFASAPLAEVWLSDDDVSRLFRAWDLCDAGYIELPQFCDLFRRRMRLNPRHTVQVRARRGASAGAPSPSSRGTASCGCGAGKGVPSGGLRAGH